MSDIDPPPTPPPSDADAPPPPPPPPPPLHGAYQRPLLRRDQGKHLAGVAGGLADYFGISTGPMRFAFLVLLFLGVGLPLYLVAWIAMPSPSQPQSYVEQWFGRSPNPVAVVAVAAVVIVLIAANDGPGDDGLGWGLALLFGGWLLFRADNRAATAGPGVPPAFTTPAPPPAGDTGFGGPATWYGPGGTAPAAPAWQPPPPRPRSMLGRLTVGLTMAAAGIAAVFDQSGAISLGASQYVALILTVVGAGLIVGTWIGRARGLIALGLLLVPVLLVTSITPLPLGAGVGEARYTPATIEAIEPMYTFGVGQVVLDLTDIDWSGESETVAVTVGVGETRIVIPDDVTVFADVEIHSGELNLFGQRFVGRPFSGPVLDTAEGSAGGGRLDLQVDHALGKVTIEQVEEF